LEKQCAKNIIDRSKEMFGLAILRRSVRTRKTQENTAREEKGVVGYVVKFFSVVTLYKANGKTKVSLDVLTKIKKYIVHF
jgi:hypothetical protein